MKSRWILLLISFCACAAASAGQSALDRLTSGSAGDVVRRGIEYAGGWDTWEQKKTVAFRKTTTRFRPDGSVERKRVELHRYVLKPELRASIEWEEDGKKIALINNGRQAWKIVEGREATSEEDRNQARNATFGSHYVFTMPFKLTDSGARLEYAGHAQLADGTPIENVLVTYEKGAGDAGGLHTWTYSFDEKTGRLAANHLNYDSGKYDFTEYFDDRMVEDLRLASRRLGYNADESGKTGPKISETLYEDIQFNVPLAESLFASPAVK